MPLSSKTRNIMTVAFADADAATEVANQVDQNTARLAQSSHFIAAMIVATSTSTTTDFGALKLGDIVVMIPAAAGNSKFTTVATAGTLAEAAIVGNLYIVYRAKV